MMINELKEKARKEVYGTEEVLVIPYALTAGIPDQFFPVTDLRKNPFPFLKKGKYALRSEVEGMYSLQQIVAYGYIIDDSGRFFVSERIGGEPRLQGKLSFFGGHVNPEDGLIPNLAVVGKTMRREIEEETNIGNRFLPYDIEIVGTVRDQTSKLPDHLGFVYEIQVEKNPDRLKTTEQGLGGRWYTKNELLADYENFENWAQYVMSWLFFLRDN